MDPELRARFNAAYDERFYPRYVARLEERLGCKIPFRVAETPLFLPAQLRERLATSAREIIAAISDPALIEKMKRAIPPELDVPGMDALPSCVQVDFAITRAPDGGLEGKVVELQAFPSLYALMVVQSDVLGERLAEMPGMPQAWSIYFAGDRQRFIEHLRRAVVAGEDPAEVVLLDLDPPAQKTYPDFAATKQLIGVDAICPTELVKEGRRLYRDVGGKRVPVRRIYNRIVFDELAVKGVPLPFSYRDDLDVSWCSHPNWYWTWSKYTLPSIDHPAVPRARRLGDLERVPEDLSRYVLKPLFSFAGSGVKVDVTPDDLAGVPEAERDNWLLQEKIVYEPALRMPDGEGVKGEVRMMFLRAPEEPAPTLVLPLVRLSRGKMIGVDHNRDLAWTGGSVGIWPA
ncbi:MAG: hypothetical protein WKG00_16150 [Polyangiaceae bacterium]